MNRTPLLCHVSRLTGTAALLTPVINSVGAASLCASLNCDAFASDHSSEAHFDRASFVGLAVTFYANRTRRPSNWAASDARAQTVRSGVQGKSTSAAVRCCMR